ncbi:MAG: ABC transporter ATP-binding protein [Hylemonella sp.]|nr:ABC transporter ATP-binding protein [Hylemonella sp.]
MHFPTSSFLLVWALLWPGLSLAQTVDSLATTPQAEAVTPAPAAAYPLTLTVAPVVYHWRDDPEHKYAFVMSLEQYLDREQLVGLALFRNSFGQPSAYAYAGYHWHDLLGEPNLSLKVSAGIIYGYTGDYADKVPLNWNGFSPGIIPSLVYKVSANGSLNLMLLGTAGVVMGYSHSFQGPAGR